LVHPKCDDGVAKPAGSIEELNELRFGHAFGGRGCVCVEESTRPSRARVY
jgi:hypothetical protein